MKTGIELIAAERERQITAEGWSAAHDDEHSLGEMRHAAVAYVILSENNAPSIGSNHPYSSAREASIDAWPWDEESFRPDTPQIESLVKAGALIAAEIDRLQRQEIQLA